MKSVLAWLCVSAAGAATVVTLDGPAARAVVIVGDAEMGGSTYVSELYAKRAGAVATANMVFNFTQVRGGFGPSWSTGRISSTALAWADADASGAAWAGSTGGTVAAQSSTALTITGIMLGSAVRAHCELARVHAAPRIHSPTLKPGRPRRLGRSTSARAFRGLQSASTARRAWRSHASAGRRSSSTPSTT
jgi:hypothetical protein